MRKYDRNRAALRGHDVREADDAVDGYFTIVLNTNPYTYLGNRPLDLVPAATLDRGLVAITFKTLKVGAVLGALGGALRGGGVKSSEHLDVQTDLSCLSDDHGRPFPYQLDGDYLGETLRAEVRASPQRGEAGLPLTGRLRRRRSD